ncbi:hypothetical protein Bca101_086855 [Brassica carinata]
MINGGWLGEAMLPLKREITCFLSVHFLRVWRGTIRGLAGTAFVYTIWCESNTRRVREAPQPAARLLIFLDKLVRNRISCLRKKAGNKYEKVTEIWFGSR